MKMYVNYEQGRVPVTVLILEGNLDGSNYQQVIDNARSLYETGTRNLLVDMSEVGFISSAGLVALHTMAMIMRGQDNLRDQDGWQSLHSIEKDIETGYQPHIKILNPTERVAKVLKTTALDQFFEVLTDQDAAIASF